MSIIEKEDEKILTLTGNHKIDITKKKDISIPTVFIEDTEEFDQKIKNDVPKLLEIGKEVVERSKNNELKYSYKKINEDKK